VRSTRSVTGLLSAVLIALLGVLPAPPASATIAKPHSAAAAPLGNGLIGWHVYRDLAELPYLASGVQSRQFSSFDRAGGNLDDGSNFNADTTAQCLANGGAGCVIAQDDGPGEITSIWSTHYSGNSFPTSGDVSADGNLEITLDGVTVLDAPFEDIVDGKVGAPFVYPLVANHLQSSGGVYINVPMTYRNSMVVSTTAQPSFYHVEYQKFPTATGVTTFDPGDHATDVLATLDNAGKQDPKPPVAGQQTTESTLSVPATSTSTVLQANGPASISALRLKFDGAVSAGTLDGLRLVISFDGRSLVNSPVGEFFGAGMGATDVGSLMFSVGHDVGDWYSTWWPMPFANNVAVSLQNTTGSTVSGITAEITVAPDSEWTAALANGTAGYFTAYSHSGPTTFGKDWTYADETGHGKYVGVSTTMYGDARADASPAPIGGTNGGGQDYLEGDERVYTDGQLSPQIYGTGTEDYYEGGWYFNSFEFNDPLNGHPDGYLGSNGCAAWCDSAYRLTLDDPVDYDNSLRLGIQHGYTDDVNAVYSSTAFLYTQPTSTLHRTDTIEVGDAASVAAHQYAASGDGSTVLRAQYEGEDDGTPVQAPVQSGTAPVSFTLAVDPANAGVLLRRTSDQDNGYQSAEVSVNGTDVGTWLQPLRDNQSRWLADTFAIPASATSGRSSIAVTLTPAGGAPPWTAASYTADSIVAPFADSGTPAAPAGLTVLGTRHAIRLSWAEPSGDTAIAQYRIYASTSPTVPITSADLVGTSTTTGFAQNAVAAHTTEHYAVVAVGLDGNAGPASPVLTATTTPWLRSDINADGTDDVVTFTQSSPAPVYAATSNGTNAFVGNAVQWNANFAGAGQITLLGDVTGNGRADAIRFTRGSTGGVYVSLSDGKQSFVGNSQWLSGFCENSDVPVAGDFNGDGRTDIACLDLPSATISVALSNGSGFDEPHEWAFPCQQLPPRDGQPCYLEGWTKSGFTPVVGDFDGDGMDDIALVDNADHQVAVALSRASYFTGTSWIWHTAFGNAGEIPAAGDFDGDGRDDIATFTPAGNVYVATSTGTGFTGSGKLWASGFAGGSAVPGVGDFTGNGRSDLVSFGRGSAGTVSVALSGGTSFQPSSTWNGHFCVGNEWCQPSTLLTSS
jgi:hypothetical protein